MLMLSTENKKVLITKHLKPYVRFVIGY